MRSRDDELTRAILDAVHQPLLVIDPDGAVAHANGAASRVLGHKDHRTLVGRSSHEALHAFHADGSTYPAHECPIVRTPAVGTPSGHEVFLDRFEHPVHVSWTVSALPRPSYRLLAFTPDAAAPVFMRQPSQPTPASLRAQVASEFHDPHLTPLRLAHTNHISLRTLQAVFARQQASPAAIIREERLNHARGLLAAGSSPGDAASGSGFDDADTFTRAFRRRYGLTPSAYRAQRQTA